MHILNKTFKTQTGISFMFLKVLFVSERKQDARIFHVCKTLLAASGNLFLGYYGCLFAKRTSGHWEENHTRSMLNIRVRMEMKWQKYLRIWKLSPQFLRIYKFRWCSLENVLGSKELKRLKQSVLNCSKSAYAVKVYSIQIWRLLR